MYLLLNKSNLLELNQSNSEGRGAAAEVDRWLSDGSSRLPSAGGIKTRVSLVSCFRDSPILILDILRPSDLHQARLLRLVHKHICRKLRNFIHVFGQPMYIYLQFHWIYTFLNGGGNCSVKLGCCLPVCLLFSSNITWRKKTPFFAFPRGNGR